MMMTIVPSPTLTGGEGIKTIMVHYSTTMPVTRTSHKTCPEENALAWRCCWPPWTGDAHASLWQMHISTQ